MAFGTNPPCVLASQNFEFGLNLKTKWLNIKIKEVWDKNAYTHLSEKS